MSHTTSPLLQHYVRELLRWNTAYNLVGKSTEHDVWERHIADAAQLADYIPQHAHVLDIGSGAGLPGLVLAALRPDITLHSVEKAQRKADFQKHCARVLPLPNVHVHNCLVETLAENLMFNVVTARAFTNLPDLWQLAQPRLLPQGFLLSPKGETWKKECEKLVQHCSTPLAVEHFKSNVSRNSQILKIHEQRDLPLPLTPSSSL